MAYKYKIVNKNINLVKLTEEFVTAGFTNFGFLMAGFHKSSDRVYEPNAGQQVIATSTAILPSVSVPVGSTAHPPVELNQKKYPFSSDAEQTRI